MSDANYTPAQELKLREVYNPKALQNERDDQVASLAKEFDKKKRSIIAKLSRMELYVAKVRATKSGAPVIQKSALVEQIAKSVGVTAATIASLSKATKVSLQALADAVATVEDEADEIAEVTS